MIGDPQLPVGVCTPVTLSSERLGVARETGATQHAKPAGEDRTASGGGVKTSRSSFVQAGKVLVFKRVVVQGS